MYPNNFGQNTSLPYPQNNPGMPSPMGQQNIYPHQNNPGMPSPMGQQNIYPSQNNPGIYLPMSHQNTYPPQNNPGFPSLPQQQVQMGFQAPPVQGEYGIRMPHQNISQMPQQGIYPNSQNAQQGYGAHTNPQNIPNINVRPQMQGNYPNVNNYAQPSGFGANSNVPYPSTNPQYQMPQQEFSGAQSVPKKQIQMEQTPQRAADGSGLAPVMLKRGNPTITHQPGFKASDDATVLYKAMKGFGTDNNALISIICHRTNLQRQQIEKAFKTSYGKDLMDDIIKETSGNFEKLLVACLTPTVKFYCIELHQALSGIGTDENVLSEVLCALSNAEIHAIKFYYEKMFGATLESHLKGDTSGYFKRLLVSLCNASRDESNTLDPSAAKADAQSLYQAGKARFGTDEVVFNQILCSRNFEQLKLIIKEYQLIGGHSLEQAIRDEFSGDIETGLLAIIKCVNSRSEFFASQLYRSMKGLGTNDSQLIRVVVTRSEIDMQDIKSTFFSKYGKTLKSFIEGDASGNYRKGLLALIGE